MIVSAVAGAENMTPLDYAQHVAPVTLMPFAREAVANLTMRGRFGPFWVNPSNMQELIEREPRTAAAPENVPGRAARRKKKVRRARK